jgi:hypothetical protein
MLVIRDGRCTVGKIKAKSFNLPTLFTLALGWAALVAPACSQQDTPPPGNGGDCGGIVGLTCAAGMYCDYEPGSCGKGDLLGTCRLIPDVCAQECTKTCGCDGKFYCNACIAHMAGIDDSAEASCFGSDIDAGLPGAR